MVCIEDGECSISGHFKNCDDCFLDFHKDVWSISKEG